MKNLNKIYLVALLAVFFAGSVEAATGVYVSPVTAIKKVGDSFSVTVSVGETASKVYAVEGTLVFDKLTCKNITVAEGVTVQTAPTCSKPYFLLGIPTGTTSGKELAVVSVSAPTEGQASVDFTGVDIIGEGASLGSSATGGDYTIFVQPTVEQSPKQTVKITPAPAKVTTSPKPEVQEMTVSETPTVAAEETSDNLAQTAAASNASNSSAKALIAVGIIIILIILAVIYFRKRKNKVEQI